MPRRREVPKREILPDPKFGNQDLSKFVNVLMTAGKKSVAERILYGALEQIVKKTSKDAVEVFNLALNNAKPQVEVKSRRVGGANYQVPVEVRPSRRMALAMRWLREAARKRGEKSMGMRLAGELIDASEGRGGAVKKREAPADSTGIAGFGRPVIWGLGRQRSGRIPSRAETAQRNTIRFSAIRAIDGRNDGKKPRLTVIWRRTGLASIACRTVTAHDTPPR